MSSGHDFVGIGYCGLDTLCMVPHIPIDEKVQISRLLIQGGGPAATATVAAARLGLRAVFVGAVGDDDRGGAILHEFEREGVDTGYISRRPGAESAAAFCWVEEASGRRSIAWTRGSAEAVRADELCVELAASAGVIHLDGHQAAAAMRAAEVAQDRGIPVFLDAGSVLPGIAELMARCDVVIASQTFARRFTGQDSPEKAVRALRECGSRWTGVTLGTAGSLGYDGERLVRAGSFPVTVVDTTGAGDVYHGAFAAEYLELLRAGHDVPDMGQCMRFAAAAAALKCRRLGGRSGIPSRQDVVGFLASQPREVQVLS